jgi:hypothetical protein
MLCTMHAAAKDDDDDDDDDAKGALIVGYDLCD